MRVERNLIRAINRKKAIVSLTILLFSALLFPAWGWAASKYNFQVVGVKSRVAKNIKLRLLELSEQKPLDSLPENYLNKEVAQAIHPYGYLNPQVTVKQTGSRSFLIKINPGPRIIIRSWTIQLMGEGANNVNIKTTLDKLPIHSNEPLNTIRYEDAKDKLKSAAENEGYLRANFTVAEVLVNLDAHSADIHWVFDTGSQFYFGRVEFDPTFISPQVLKRYLPFQYGEPYSTEKVLALNSALAASGYFSDVTIKPQFGNNPLIPLDVHLQEASRFNYSLGIGYGTDTGPRGRLGLHVIPVNSAGHKFNAIAQGSFKQNIVEAQYQIPGKNPLLDQYNITGGFSNLNYNAGSSNSILLSFAQQHTQDKFQRNLSLNGLYERFHYFVQPDDDTFVFFPKANFTWTNTTDELFSPNGYKVSITGLGGTQALLSDINFAQASLDAKAAITVSPIRTRLFLHTIQGVTGIDDIDDLPLSLAFLLGGSENLKAYSFNSIGPGKFLTYYGLEIQKETVEKWYLVGFFDTGDVYMPSLKSLKNDFGLGIMWISPVGPIQVGLAQAVDNHFHFKDHRPRLVISMGPDL